MSMRACMFGLVTLTALGCGANEFESDDELTSDALVSDETQNANTASYRGVARRTTKADLVAKASERATWLRTAFVENMNFRISDGIPHDIRATLASGDRRGLSWSTAPVDFDFRFDQSRSVPKGTITIVGASRGKGARIDLSVTVSAEEGIEDSDEEFPLVRLTVTSTAKVLGDPAASQAFATAASKAVFQVLNVSAFEVAVESESR